MMNHIMMDYQGSVYLNKRYCFNRVVFPNDLSSRVGEEDKCWYRVSNKGVLNTYAQQQSQYLNNLHTIRTSLHTYRPTTGQ